MSKCQILFLSANPKETGRLQLMQAFRDIKQAIERSKYEEQIDLEPVLAVRATDILPAFRKYKPQVVHFQGHGTSQDAILIEDDQPGKAKRLTTDMLLSLFEPVKQDVRLVVLAACFSVHQAKALSKIVPCTIGISDATFQHAPTNFAKGFYGSIGDGLSIQEAFDFGKAEVHGVGGEFELEHGKPQIFPESGVDFNRIFLVDNGKVSPTENWDSTPSQLQLSTSSVSNSASATGTAKQDPTSNQERKLVEIVLEHDFDQFTQVEQGHFLKGLQNFLRTNASIVIRNKYKGSVRLFVEMQGDLAKKLHEACPAEIAGFKVAKVRLLIALVMKGGGINGLAYIGALEVLYDDYEFSWFVGTSAGAITAVLLGAGYTPEELKLILKEKDFRDFFDAPWYKKLPNLLFKGGIHPADTFTNWIGKLLAKKLNSRTPVKLSDLPNRVTIYASQDEKKALKFDSFDNDADAADAVRCSMSIPFVFIPQKNQGRFAFDDGLQHNFPIQRILEEYKHIDFLNLYIGPKVDKPGTKPELQNVSQNQEKTVVIDPRPVKELEFDLSDEEKEYLLASGKAEALAFIGSPSEQIKDAISNRDRLKSVVEMKVETRARLSWRKFQWAAIAAAILFVIAAIIVKSQPDGDGTLDTSPPGEDTNVDSREGQDELEKQGLSIEAQGEPSFLQHEVEGSTSVGSDGKTDLKANPDSDRARSDQQKVGSDGQPNLNSNTYSESALLDYQEFLKSKKIQEDLQMDNNQQKQLFNRIKSERKKFLERMKIYSQQEQRELFQGLHNKIGFEQTGILKRIQIEQLVHRQNLEWQVKTATKVGEYRVLTFDEWNSLRKELIGNYGRSSKKN